MGKSTTALKICNVTEFQTKMKVAESKISSLISSNNARSQDFLALLNQINKRSNKVDSEISLLNFTTETKLTDLGKIQMDNNQATTKEISELQVYMNQTGMHFVFIIRTKNLNIHKKKYELLLTRTTRFVIKIVTIFNKIIESKIQILYINNVGGTIT